MIKKFLTYCYKKKRIVCPDIFIGTGTVVLLLAITLLFALAIWWLNHNPLLQDFWKDFPVDHKTVGMLSEKIEMNKPVRHPVSVFSGIIYLIVAIIIFKESQKELKNSGTHNQNNKNLIHKIFFIFILLYVFFASTFYHASLIKPALKIDYSAVYFFSLFPVMYFSYRWLLSINWKQSRISKKEITVVVYLIYITVCLLLSFFTPRGKEQIVSFVCILIFFAFAITTILASHKKMNLNYLVLSVIFTMIALVWFKFDKHTILFNPNSYFQAHSLWNLFIGLSGFYFYVFIRTDEH
ncbi:hypothetical protein [Flavobacterium gawalongense]|uniref:Uncharacterized protein n=1 Tax=Flavobacterium gawalongense TaxID=2594432 RepID=A0ABY3CQ11_9FLAO|nr:hypothetical protein [Flavobacterium gawalongense]TRW98998.1 hypothetical protein FNW33_15090 [Flavobacterium gawalongense]TRX09937.1 hypothetical protein FNW12_02135 [Flavobacterium gawalongense]